MTIYNDKDRVSGGVALPDARTQYVCEQACLLNPRCLALSWKPSEGTKCWSYTTIGEMSDSTGDIYSEVQTRTCSDSKFVQMMDSNFTKFIH